MKYLALLLLSLPCMADSIQLPSTGYVWVDRNPANLSQVAYTVSNLGFGEYTPTEEIYSLQFSQYLVSGSQFFYRMGELGLTGTFSSWTFQNGLFVGTFAGTELDYVAGTWGLRSMTPVDGSLSQQLTLIPGCYGNDAGCGTIGTGLLTLSGNELATVPEPKSWMLAITSVLFMTIVFGRTKGNCEHSFRTR